MYRKAFHRSEFQIIYLFIYLFKKIGQQKKTGRSVSSSAPANETVVPLDMAFRRCIDAWNSPFRSSRRKECVVTSTHSDGLDSGWGGLESGWGWNLRPEE